jgi:hypothetical protein
MGKSESPYYPPRAHWYAGVFRIGDTLRRRLSRDRIRIPTGVSFARLVGGCLVPGFAFYLRGPRFWGQIAMAACALLAFAFVVWLGYPAGNYAFGMLLSIHLTALTYLCEPWLTQAPLRSRILFSMAVMGVLGLGLYMPARTLIQERWCLPMRINNQIVIVQRLASSEAIKRGDWIAYSISTDHGDGVYVKEGFGLAPVLACGGDKVLFSEQTFSVNGISRPRREHMPGSGEWVVPEKHWFAWPDLVISTHGIAESTISAAILHMATVPQERFMGRPFKRWFWRRQIMS